MAPAPTTPPNVPLTGIWRDLSRGVRWTLSFVGLLLYTWDITTYQLHLANVMMGLAAAGLLLQKHRWRAPSTVLWMLAFVAWCLVGYAQTRYPGPTWDTTYALLKVCIVSMVLGNAVGTRAQLRFFIVVWLAAFALFPLRGALLVAFHYGATSGRTAWQGAFGNPNDLAALSLLMLGLCVPMAETDRNPWVRRAAYAGCIMIVLVIFLTQSRGGLIALTIFGILFLVESRRARRAAAVAMPKKKRKSLKRVLQMGATAAVLGVTVAVFAPKGVWDRLGGLTNFAHKSTDLRAVDPEGSAEQRLEIWKVALQVIQENPIFGVGYGAYPQAHYITSLSPQFKPLARGYRDTHSTPLNVTAETGLVGAALFFGIFIATWRYAGRAIRQLRRHAPADAHAIAVCRIGLAAFLTAGVWGSFSRIQFLYFFTALIWTMAATNVAEWRRHAPPPPAPR